MNRKDLFLLLLIFLVAVILRCYDITYPSFRWMDESGHVPAATNYWNNGQFEPDNWEHPPLRHILLYGFLKLFGDNPVGWRMRNVLFGALAAAVTYLFAREISGNRKAGLLAGLLLASDPLHIILSRFTYEEIYGGMFFLAAVFLYARYGTRTAHFLGMSLLLGCALATKWYYLPGWLLICCLALWSCQRDFKTVVSVVATSFLVPVGVFVLSYWQWFGRGYGLPELWEFLVNAYHAQQLYQSNNFDYGLFFLSHTSAAEWFVKPLIMGQGTYLAGGGGEFVVYMNNLPVWGLTIPGLVLVIVTAVKNRSLKLLYPVAFFCATYMLFLFVKRPTFIYSAIPLLPFAFTAIALAIVRLSEKHCPKAYYVVLVAAVGFSLYLYPFVTAKKIPVSLYQPFIKAGHIQIH